VAFEDRLLVARCEADDWSTDERLVGRDFECVAASPDRPERAFAGTAESGVQRSTDGGDSWERVASIEDRVTALGVSPHDPDTVWAGTEPSAVYRSTDGGDTWTALPDLTTLDSSERWSYPPRSHTHNVRWLEPDPHDPDRLAVAIEAGALVRTTDGGQTWIDHPDGARRDNHTLATHPDVPGRLYAAAGDGYAQSEDGGDTWHHPQDGLDHRYVWGLAVPESDPGTVVASAASGARRAHIPSAARAYVYRTTDAGRIETGDTVRWERAMDGLPDPGGTVRSVFAASDGALFAVNNRGCYRSADAGGSWRRLDLAWPDEYEQQAPAGVAVV
jgi:photosystem II stability/assembly factor-like uncharacterized protein